MVLHLAHFTGKNHFIQVPNGFSVKVFKGPALSSCHYAATPKFDLGYRTHPSANSWQKLNWSLSETKKKPPLSDAPGRFPRFIVNKDPPNRHSYDPSRSASPPNYSIYPSASQDTYIYERSLYSKSDTYTESDNTSEAASSPSSCFSTALSNDSTTTLQSTAPTPSLTSNSTGELAPPAAHIPFPYRNSAVNYSPPSTRGGPMEDVTSGPVIRPLTTEPVIRIPASSGLDEDTSLLTGSSVPHSLYSCTPSAVCGSREPYLPPAQNDGQGTRISPIPLPAHETDPSSGYLTSAKDIYSTSATRGSSSSCEATQYLREPAGSRPEFPSVQEPRYAGDVPVLARGEGYPASTRFNRAESSRMTRVRRDIENRVSSGEFKSVTELVGHGPQTPYLSSGQMLNDHRVKSPASVKAGWSNFPPISGEDPHSTSATIGSAEQSEHLQPIYRTRDSEERRNSRDISSPSLARGELNTGQDPLDLAERGESPPITQRTGDSGHGVPIMMANEGPHPPSHSATVMDLNERQDRALPLSTQSTEPHLLTAHISLGRGEPEPYASTASRAFIDPAELLQNRHGRTLDNRDLPSHLHSQSMADAHHQRGPCHPVQRERTVSVLTAPPAASAGMKRLTSRRGDVGAAGVRHREPTTRQEAFDAMQPRQDVGGKYSSTYLAGSTEVMNDVENNVLLSGYTLRQDLDDPRESNPGPVYSPSFRSSAQPPPLQTHFGTALPQRTVSGPSRLVIPSSVSKTLPGVGTGPRSATTPVGARCVRWDTNLIAPSPIFPRQRRKGWFNRRGYVYKSFISLRTIHITHLHWTVTNSG